MCGLVDGLLEQYISGILGSFDLPTTIKKTCLKFVVPFDMEKKKQLCLVKLTFHFLVGQKAINSV